MPNMDGTGPRAAKACAGSGRGTRRGECAGGCGKGNCRIEQATDREALIQKKAVLQERLSRIEKRLEEF